MSEVLCYTFFKYTLLRRELLKINAPQIPAKRHRLYIRYLFLTMKSLVQARQNGLTFSHMTSSARFAGLKKQLVRMLVSISIVSISIFFL